MPGVSRLATAYSPPSAGGAVVGGAGGEDYMVDSAGESGRGVVGGVVGESSNSVGREEGPGASGHQRKSSLSGSMGGEWGWGEVLGAGPGASAKGAEGWGALDDSDDDKAAVSPNSQPRVLSTSAPRSSSGTLLPTAPSSTGKNPQKSVQGVRPLGYEIRKTRGQTPSVLG